MSTFDYESMAHIRFHDRLPPVLEAYRGSDIVDWHGRIEQSLVNLLNDAEKANNQTYGTRLRTFLETWRENPIDGSLNRETIETLAAAAKQWSRENWDLQSYFLSLNTKLRQLIASEEELPRDIDMTQTEPPMGGAGGRSTPPVAPTFGPEKEAPGTEEPPPEPGEQTQPPGTEAGPGTPPEPGETPGEGLGGELEPDEYANL